MIVVNSESDILALQWFLILLGTEGNLLFVIVVQTTCLHSSSSSNSLSSSLFLVHEGEGMIHISEQPVFLANLSKVSPQKMGGKWVKNKGFPRMK